MISRRVRDLRGAPPSPDRIFWSGMWFRTHNNARYAELLPRLERLDAYFVTFAGARVPRGLQYRAYRGLPGTIAQRLLLPRAARRYRRGMLCTEFRQIPLFPGPIVLDVDDPFFEEPELSLFRHPNVVAVVTLAEWARERYAELGVTVPIHVVPQGVSLSSLSAGDVARVRALRRDGEIALGYVAALLSTRDDVGMDPLYEIDHLLELWEEIRAQSPDARLWLVGEPTERARRRLAGRDDVVLFGRVPREQVLAHVANFDVALYPRTKGTGIQAAKIAEYLGAGAPTVSYGYRVADIVRETGGGIVVETPREFVDAAVRLVRDESERRRLAEAARAAGAALDWDVLARRYESEILDRYLTPLPA